MLVPGKVGLGWDIQKEERMRDVSTGLYGLSVATPGLRASRVIIIHSEEQHELDVH